MRQFELTEDQQRRIAEWKSRHKRVYCGAIGGHYTYELTPTSLGVIVKVRDAVTKEELDVSDYESW